MVEFYSKIVPRIRDEARFGKAGLAIKLHLCYYNEDDELTRCSMIVIYHSVQETNVGKIRGAIERLVKDGILWQNPVEQWMEMFFRMLLIESWQYFSAPSKQLFESYKLSVFIPSLLRF